MLYGGEPLLLPASYLTDVVHLARQSLPVVARFDFTLQSNLTRADAPRLNLLETPGIGLGVSLDVFGVERVHGSGRPAEERVIQNLQLLREACCHSRRRLRRQMAESQRGQAARLHRVLAGKVYSGAGGGVGALWY